MIKVKLLTPTAKLPTRNNPTDAGLDLHADNSYRIEVGHRVAVNTGVALSIPYGYVARIAPRSGLAVHCGIDVLAGVVDSSYRGEIKVVLINHGNIDFHVTEGNKIAQLLIQPVELWTPELVDELDETERGEKGFGSSGK